VQTGLFIRSAMMPFDAPAVQVVASGRVTTFAAGR
jgi:hypothetical protein